MKYSILLAVIFSAQCFAADNSNPFTLASAGGPGALLDAALPSQIKEDVLPMSFTENRTLFDMLEVVARSANSAILRYPVMVVTPGAAAPIAGGAQGVTYRDLVFKKGQVKLIAGRSFKAVFPVGETNVQLLDSKGKIVWEGDLSSPKVYSVNPNMIDYQYTPPPSAGTGVGQTIVSTSPSSTPSPSLGAAPQAIMPGGVR
jgi:hypothetical protein